MASLTQAEEILEALERAGWEAYLVGGCVRDMLLGRAAHDFDICTRALPEQTARVFRDIPQDDAGRRHGTVKLLLPQGDIEITTFRREGGYTDGRHPGWVEFVPDVQTDLARRDFTVNAMAWSPVRGYADPFGGQEDLKNKILRCVGQPRRRFEEDGLRILRGIRFAARFQLAVEDRTMDAMIALAPLTRHLAPERTFEELTGFLLAAQAEDILRFAPILTALIPELASAVGFDQCSPHHAYDVYTHIAHVTQAVPAEPVLRWAALLHDIGKVPCFTLDENGRGHFKGHAQVGAQIAEAVLDRLKAPAALRREAVWLVAHHMAPMEPDERLLRRALSRYGAARLEALLALQQADMESKGTREHQAAPYFARIRAALEEMERNEGRITLRALAVNGRDMMDLGLSGRQIGQTLDRLLEGVLDGRIPNDRAALLRAAKEELACSTIPTKP